MRNTISLPPEVEILGEQANAALHTLRKSYESWVTIGRFVVAVRKIADQRGGRLTYYRILEQHGFSDPARMKTVLSKLERMMEKEAEATDWHRRLPDEAADRMVQPVVGAEPLPRLRRSQQAPSRSARAFQGCAHSEQCAHHRAAG